MIDHAKSATPVSTSEWDYSTIRELGAALASRRISASELLEHTVARVEALDGRVNAVVVRDFERARETAREADAALGKGERRPLLGIPLTFKEPFNVAGLPTTWGFTDFKNFVPKEDALIVSRVKRAGAVLLGKTNVPVGLGDVQSYNALYGTTNNPRDVSRSPGGSSGGSAAALAAGFGPLSFGSDIGGSLRQPEFAHFCAKCRRSAAFTTWPARPAWICTLPVPFTRCGWRARSRPSAVSEWSRSGSLANRRAAIPQAEPPQPDDCRTWLASYSHSEIL